MSVIMVAGMVVLSLTQIFIQELLFFVCFVQQTFFCSQGSADIIPKVQTATEHSHFFDTFLHVSENACFGQTHARNHLKM